MQVQRRGLRFALWAWTLLMLTPAGLTAQNAVAPPVPVPVTGEAPPPPPSIGAPAFPALPPPISPMPAAVAVPPAPPSTSFLAGIQQRRQQRFQQRQDRRHHMVEKVKSLFGA